jgi:hypothetical protein
LGFYSLFLRLVRNECLMKLPFTSVLRLYPVLIGLLYLGCTKNLTVANTVYDNDFSNSELGVLRVSGWNNGSFGALPTPRLTNYYGRTVLGKLNNNIVRLELTKLPDHAILRVEVEMYIHNTWKNDLWKMECDGQTRILTGFSTDPQVKQSYPNWLGNGSPLSEAGANAMQKGLPGVCGVGQSSLGTNAYTVVQTFTHSSNEFILQLSDASGNVNDTCSRSWSIRKLTITTFHN